MEYRHYITFAIAFITLQLLVLNFSRTIGWLGNLSDKKRKIVTLTSYLFANGLIFLQFFKTFQSFRLVAFLLAFLMFIFFVRLGTMLIYTFGKLIIPVDRLNKWLKIAYLPVLAGFMALTIYNAYVPKVIHYQITLDKHISPLRIGVASDLHLGKFFGNKQLDTLADIFNREKVDLILLPGDIMDDNTQVYTAEQMQSHLSKLKAPLGVYATLGNHDFLGSQKDIADEIRKAGIQVLWDQAVEIEGKFTIIGRNDDLVKNRPSAEQLLKDVNTRLPIFLLDHRPTQIEEHSKLPIDIQVSGHTHKGQIFPANIVTSLMYRLDYGYEKIENGHFFVTSGYGFWGIPMRLGSQSEVLIIDVKGK